MTSETLKIFFYAIDGTGHINACVGLAQPLAKRGHKIYFLLNDAFKGQFAKFGFEEILLTQKPTALENGQAKSGGNDKEVKKNPVKEMADLLKTAGFLGPKSSLEKLRDQVEKNDNFMDKFYQQIVEYNPQIGAAIEREKPDAIIMDTFIVPPAARQAGIPWMMLFSPNPSFLFKSKKLPPFGSGFPTNSDPSTWEEYLELWKVNWKRNFSKYQDNINEMFHFVPDEHAQEKEEDDMFNFSMSPYLNVYGFPAELDYDDIAPRPDNLVAVDAFCRVNPESWQVPAELAEKPGDKLIYVSLGSMGSIDVQLMKRITSLLAKTSHRYVVSKGQRGEEYDLPENCWGENFLPQTAILPLVDLVITHGGNNTVTETLSMGKPMIVMPLFGDQYDNAQRVQEKGYGIRIEPYEITDTNLTEAIEKILKDTEMQKKAKAAGERMAQSESKEKVAQRIEEVIGQFKQAQ